MGHFFFRVIPLCFLIHWEYANNDLRVCILIFIAGRQFDLRSSLSILGVKKNSEYSPASGWFLTYAKSRANPQDTEWEAIARWVRYTLLKKRQLLFAA